MSPSPDFIQRANAAYIEEQYDRYQLDPGSVSSDWAAFFAGVDLAGVHPTGRPPATEAPVEKAGRLASGVFGLVQHYRVQGHLAARLDPLGQAPVGSPLL